MTESESWILSAYQMNTRLISNDNSRLELSVIS